MRSDTDNRTQRYSHLKLPFALIIIEHHLLSVLDVPQLFEDIQPTSESSFARFFVAL